MAIPEIYSYTIHGLPLQTGDIICTQDGAIDPAHPEAIRPGAFWLRVGRLVPGEVDHIAIYLGPGGRCIEASPRGVICFTAEGGEWNAIKMMTARNLLLDTFYGVAYPLEGRGLSPEEERRIRAEVSAYCLAQLGKPYNFNLLNPDKEKAFYCSQLAYKAYLPYGIHMNSEPDIRVLPGTQRIVYPQEVWDACPHKKVATPC